MFIRVTALPVGLQVFEGLQNGPRQSKPAFRFARVLATVLISVFTLCYGPRLLFCGPPLGVPWKSSPVL